MDSNDDRKPLGRSKRCGGGQRVKRRPEELALFGLRLRGLLEPVMRPDGLVGYGLTDEARAMLKQINAEDGHDVDDVG
jgi:hypothetical protein